MIKFKAPEGKGGQLVVYVIPGKPPKVRGTTTVWRTGEEGERGKGMDS